MHDRDAARLQEEWFTDMDVVRDKAGLMERAEPASTSGKVDCPCTRQADTEWRCWGIRAMPTYCACSISTDHMERLMYAWNGLQTSKAAVSRETMTLQQLDVQDQCKICFDDFSVKEMRSAACNHRFCRTCWIGYVGAKVAEGPAVLGLRCPLPNCQAAVRSRPKHPRSSCRRSPPDRMISL